MDTPLNVCLSDQILHIIDKCIHWNLCLFFVEKVDPKRDHAKDYYDIIQNPMWLKEIKRKLKLKMYSTPREVLDDFELLCDNAVTYNQECTPVAQAAEELRSYVERKFKKLYSTEMELYCAKVQKQVEKIQSLMSEIKHITQKSE